MSEHENPTKKEEALRRLSEPEGDHELHAALERMRLDHPHLWGVLHRRHLAHDADPEKLEEQLRSMVSSAVYGFEYVPAGAQEGLEEQGFGPEPY